jgi:hypothetical protein
MAQYIAHRFSHNGSMNLHLASALRCFGDSRTGREILYFEYLRSVPLLNEIAVRWLAELPEQGGSRASLLSFLETRLSVKRHGEIAKSALTVFRKLGRIQSQGQVHYIPIWSEPLLEAFLYILARMYPERTMVRLEAFAGENIIRGMLWPASSIPVLLKAAESIGHISKISQLDQYHQFTLASAGDERMRILLGDLETAAIIKPAQSKGEATSQTSEQVETLAPEEETPLTTNQNQLDLFNEIGVAAKPSKPNKKGSRVS